MDQHIAVSIMNMALIVTTTIHLYYSNIVSGDTKRNFALGFLVVATCCIGDFIYYIAENFHIISNNLLVAAMIIQAAIAPAGVYFWLMILNDRKLAKLAFFICSINIICQILAAPYDLIIYINNDGMFERGEYYWIYSACYFSAVIIIIIGTLLFSKQYQHRNFLTLMLIAIFLFTGIAANSLSSDFPIAWQCITVSSILLYIYYIELAVQSDKLTGMLSRRSYETSLEHLNYRTAIILFDVDKFKKINDSYGHNYGDKILKLIANAIISTFGRIAQCYRIGGDEFCVILNKKSFKSDEDIIRICQKFQKMLEELRLHEPLLPNVSFGHKVFDGNQKYLKQNIEEADTMMYKIKQEHHSRMQG